MTENWKNLLTDVAQKQHDIEREQPELFLCPLTGNAVTTLIGEQSEDYLQGQLTNDMRKLTEHNYLKSSHCDAKGKAWSIMDVFTIGSHYLLTGAAAEVEASRAQLQKYGVFSKTEIADASEQWLTFGLAGVKASVWLSEQLQVEFSQEQTAQDFKDGKVLKLDDQRFIIVTQQPKALLDLLKENVYDSQLWRYVDIIAARPHLTPATSGQHVPQAFNLQALDAISFDKGCYTGQEMVARMKYLGKNKRATYILQGTATALPEDGHEIQLALGENWRRSGIAFNYAGTPDNLYLLAILPNSLEPDAQLRLKDDENSALSIKPLPYDLNAD